MDETEVVREFIIESAENLSRLDNELVELEKRPGDLGLLASVFRTFHTIKGTCGFLGFPRLEELTHEAESLLSRLRSGELKLTPVLVSLILEVIDATRLILNEIESTGCEGEARNGGLIGRLRQHTCAASAPQAADAAAAENPAGEAGSESGSALAESAIRVDVNLLDKLMNLVGELVLARNQILQHQTGNEDAALNATSQRLNLITTELQEGVMKTRMQPIGVVWNKLPRVVRDIACSLGKQIRLEMQGASTELDKTIIEAIKDPLTHLVRNCCDHGIECPATRQSRGKSPVGRVLLRAWHEGGQVLIEISDDGGGLDLQALREKAAASGHFPPGHAERLSDAEARELIFVPGLSTARSVTNVSGRGVGMDVVKCNVERIGGSVEIFSQPGAGVCVRLKIPLTLAIIPGLVVALNDRRSSPRQAGPGGMAFIIPQANLVELVRLEGQAARQQIHQIRNSSVYRLRGELLPVVDLRATLGLAAGKARSEVVSIVVVQAENRQFGLIVDSIRDTQEIVVKPLGKQLKGVSVYAGATIMGDGRVALILDAVGLGQRARAFTAGARQNGSARKAGASESSQRQRLLLFGAGRFERLAVPLSLVARLEEFPRSSLEQAGGRTVVQYRGGILPLIPLAPVLDPGAVAGPEADPIEVIVVHDGCRAAGLVVDRIVDIVEDELEVRETTGRPGLLGSAVVGGKVVDFLDLHYALASVPAAKGAASGIHLVLAESSDFARGLLRSGLELAGYRVWDAASAEQAREAIERHSPGLLVASLDLDPVGRDALLAAARGRPGLALLALASGPPAEAGFEPARPGLEECQAKFDWEAMAHSLQRLGAAVAADSRPAAVGPAR